jgi:hypothetical protein
MESIFLQTYKNLCNDNNYKEKEWKSNKSEDTMKTDKKQNKTLGEDKVRPIYTERNITKARN